MDTPRILFRADASTRIGTGHVMRCLTLADVLAQHGASCAFVSRLQAGHLVDFVREGGYECIALPESAADAEADARETIAAVPHSATDWLVVDHYGLDARWEQMLRTRCRGLMAIDDLADRPHDCDLLLDQNLGRHPADYCTLVPATARVLTGAAYAMLRPEFARLRESSLSRRRNGPVRELLVSLGGTDPDNNTAQVLQALAVAELPANCRVTVVMGAKAPWLDDVRRRADALPYPAEVVVNARDLAARMAQSDLAIGAAGTTAWERCCLGLPTLIVLQAENQRPGAKALAAAGAAILLPEGGRFGAELASQVARLTSDAAALSRMQDANAAVTDGLGAGRVAAELLA